ncbi:hypothetical protein [Nocardia mexicana]|uniref:Uncharacterized protein n=1 Tax=Nocardia mexicana TaxID=279262 RepID=A0A370H9X8_9NOCA|nr:hypothetical protein [Nocardia mexicana]RDI51131.1 hypothetical protein DFR68_105609 [Nocardia mexicana]
MTSTAGLDPTWRRRAAQRALDDLGQRRNSHILLRVRCGRNHHVATVFDTIAGPVYESTIGPHAHGHRDFVDEPHHAHHHGTRHVDFLDAELLTTEPLPAACECGNHELSRPELQQAIDTQRRTVPLA